MLAGILIVMERAPLGFGIRFSSQSGDEGSGFSDHTANWFLDDEGQEFLIHSTAKGTHELRDWREVYDIPKHWGVVVVPIGYTEEDHWKILSRSREFVGKKYDKCAIAKHFLDGMAGKILRRPVYFFRRFRLKFWKRQDRYNICSWLSCHTWREIGHGVLGLVRDKVKLRWWPPGIKRTYRKESIGCQFVAPNDWERAAFVHNGQGYRVIEEVGTRPKNLPASYIAKISADRAACADWRAGLLAP